MLKGKNSILTGANRGIGNAILRLFAANSCNVWACARTRSEAFEEHCLELAERHQVWIKPVYFDLTSEEAIKEGFLGIFREKLPIDILVNNAGVCHSALFRMTPLRTIREHFEVNVLAVMALTQLVLKAMTRQRSGCIINMASIAASDPSQTNCLYGSTKAALVAFTRNLATELGADGIRVNAIAPGPTETDMLSVYGDTPTNGLLGNCVLGRYATPEEVAEVALFLASERSSFINGQVLRVDGGFTK